ncbi:MAG: SGNH/GDSL hydrolase family protein, partial [Gammaproteobacteria bacterium]|nr:SGNH/GDSL hydrolase family protein [Gammaproteobacteria bacterium]
MPNGGFGGRKHKGRIVTCIPGPGKLYRCGDMHTYIDMMIEAVTNSDLVILLIGSNDIVQEPDRINQLADQVCQIGRELLNSHKVRQVAFVEVFHRFGPKGFEGGHQRFQATPGTFSQEECDDVFARLAGDFNIQIRRQFHGHENFHFIALDAMKYNPRSWLLSDGTHLNPRGLRKLQTIIRRRAINITSSWYSTPRPLPAPKDEAYNDEWDLDWGSGSFKNVTPSWRYLL